MKVQNLNRSELTWLGQMREVGRLMHEAYVGLGTVPDVHALDATWVKWQSDESADRTDSNTVVNALAICFGQQLVDRLDFRWAVITDEHGTEMGCIGQPGDITVFPANATAKRLERGARPFFADLFADIESRVRALRRG